MRLERVFIIIFLMMKRGRNASSTSFMVADAETWQHFCSLKTCYHFDDFKLKYDENMIEMLGFNDGWDERVVVGVGPRLMHIAFSDAETWSKKWVVEVSTRPMVKHERNRFDFFFFCSGFLQMWLMLKHARNWIAVHAETCLNFKFDKNVFSETWCWSKRNAFFLKTQ